MLMALLADRQGWLVELPPPGAAAPGPELSDNCEEDAVDARRPAKCKFSVEVARLPPAAACGSSRNWL